MKDFEKLKKELKGYNLEWVAEQAKVSPNTLYLWLSGVTKSPHFRTVVAVGRVLGYHFPMTKLKKLRLVA